METTANRKTSGGLDLPVRLSTLWVFLLFNFLYCDVITVFDPTVPKDLTPAALLGASILMEIPIAMVLLSRVLGYRANRRANIVAGTVMAAVQVATVAAAPPTLYYAFFSTVEIATLVFVVWRAWKWAGSERLTLQPLSRHI